MIDVIMSCEIAKTMFKALRTLVNEAVVSFKDDGIGCVATDMSNIAMVIVTARNDVFRAYSVDEEQNVGLDIARIYEIIKNAKKKDSVELKVTDDYVNVRLGAIEYTIGVIDPQTIRVPKIPDLELPAEVVMDADRFKEAINTAKKISDEVILKVDENGFSLESVGDIENLKMLLGTYDLIEHNNEKATARYSVEYLQEFVKIVSAGDILKICFGNDLPARFIFDVVDGQLRVEYILAPRIAES